MTQRMRWSIGPATKEDDERCPGHGPIKLVIYGQEKWWPVLQRHYFASMDEAARHVHS